MHCGVSPVLSRLVIIWFVAETSANSPGTQDTTDYGEMDGIKYLTKFGYLGKIRAKKYQHQDTISKSIREFQKFNGLPVTGQFDQLTRDKMKRPRCGRPDRKPSKRRPSALGYHVADEKWQKRDLTYKFVSYTIKLEEDQQISAVANAFKLWSDVIPLTFQAQNGPVDIEIGFNSRDHGDGPDNIFDGNGGTLAHAFFPGDYDISGDVHFDDDEDWTMGTEEGINFETVAAHEFGHVLGLEHSSVPGALMGPYYPGFTPNFSLHADDIQGIESLYGSWLNSPSSSQPQPQSPTQPATATPPKISFTPPRRCRKKTNSKNRRNCKKRIGKNKHTKPISKKPHKKTHIKSKSKKRPKKNRGKRSPGGPKKRMTTPAAETDDDHCTFSFDAIEQVHDGSILAFHGDHVYKLNERDPIHTSRAIGQVFQVAPQSPDAVVYDSRRRKLFIFKAKVYWRYTGYMLDAGYPRSLPTAFQGMSAAVQKDDVIYLFKGNNFTQWTETWSSLPEGFPRNSSEYWTNLPEDVKAAFRSSAGDYFFFKDQSFWRYTSHGVLPGFPADINRYWLNCLGSFQSVKHR